MLAARVGRASARGDGEKVSSAFNKLAIHGSSGQPDVFTTIRALEPAPGP